MIQGVEVQDTFAGVAPRYDLLNWIMSLGQDGVWRRLAASKVSADGGLALDLATGTGKMAFELARRADYVITVDFCAHMLQKAQWKAACDGRGSRVGFFLADALALPFPENSFDCAATAFTVRNVASISRCLAELCRVLRPGGHLVCLELVKPATPVVASFYRFYLYRLVPLLARCLGGDRLAYTYLADSVFRFLTADELRQLMEGAGLIQVYYRLLSLGTVAIHSALKPEDRGASSSETILEQHSSLVGEEAALSRRAWR